MVSAKPTPGLISYTIRHNYLAELHINNGRAILSQHFIIGFSMSSREISLCLETKLIEQDFVESKKLIYDEAFCELLSINWLDYSLNVACIFCGRSGLFPLLSCSKICYNVSNGNFHHSYCQLMLFTNMRQNFAVKLTFLLPKAESTFCVFYRNFRRTTSLPE